VEPLARRLVETVAWCGLRPRSDDPARDLRSRELQPECLRAPPRMSFPHPAYNTCYSAGRSINELTSSELQAVVDRIAADRAAFLRDLAIASSSDLSAGRLLAYEPFASLWDGAAEVESGGFFDDDNTPPWDTWVAWISRGAEHPRSKYRGDGYILCWVPEALLVLAAGGIWANPEECILWADTPDPELVARLTEGAARLAR
jgi:hypothetical protein